jgi:hypothetical protein
MTETSRTAKCSHCGHRLAPTHTGPCPNCGKTGKTIEIELVSEVNIATSLSWVKRREYVQKRPVLNVLLWAVTIGSPFIGLLAGGPIGVAIGLVVGLVTQLLGPYAITKIIETERGGG